MVLAEVAVIKITEAFDALEVNVQLSQEKCDDNANIRFLKREAQLNYP